MPLNSVLGGVRTAFTLLVLSILLLMGCTPSATEERWMGHYLLYNVNEKFPIYLQLKLTGTNVEGIALDGSLEIATITGSSANGIYELMLHPLKHGSNTNQDIIYRAERNGASLSGEWEHNAGVKGSWTATATDLTRAEAESVLLAACPNEDKQDGPERCSVAA